MQRVLLLLMVLGCGRAGVIDVPTDEPDTPQASGPCTPGESYCTGDTLNLCSEQGSWGTFVCNLGCKSGECVSAACTPGLSRCAAPRLAESCTLDGRARQTVCDHGCLNGACVDVMCRAGLTFCEPDGNKVLRCTTDGSDVEVVESCPHGCDGATATCSPPACAVGERRCGPVGDPEVCNDDRTGFVSTGEACSEACQDGECVVSACQPNQKRCGGKGVQTCNSAGTGFTTTEECDWGCLENNEGAALCALCLPSAYRCDGLDIQFCEAPFQPWKTIKTCKAIDTCAQGQCVQVLSLVGTATQDSVLLLLVEAIADCWLGMQDSQLEHEVCRGLNTVTMEGDLSKEDVSGWFCNNADDGLLTPDDFVTTDHFTAAKDVLGCGFLNLDDLTIDTLNKKIHAGLAQVECIAYDKDDSEIIIAPCENLP